MLYEWVKVIHIISVIAWMAVLLLMPRLFVYHAQAMFGSDSITTLQMMEARLYRSIMTPAMIAVWISGLFLAYSGGWLSSGWLHGKLLLVVLLSGFHGFLGAERRRLAVNRQPRPARFYRIVHQVPVLLMVGIVILVVLKPF